MLISVIIPVCNKTKYITPALDRLAGQFGNYEVILVACDQAAQTLAGIESQAKVILGQDEGEQPPLNVGATAASGDVLLFLEPDNQLPPGALPAIEHNLRLLSETIGGNFHLKFKPPTLFTKMVSHLVKWQRYRGYYSSNSGLFIRKTVYEALGGFRPAHPFAAYDLAQQMERYGPTLYLPDAIVAPTPGYKTVFRWLVAPVMMKIW